MSAHKRRRGFLILAVVALLVAILVNGDVDAGFILRLLSSLLL
jgi:hypothetical protein